MGSQKLEKGLLKKSNDLFRLALVSSCLSNRKGFQDFGLAVVFLMLDIAGGLH